MLRFWDPREGSARINGMDLLELRPDGLRERVALVSQDTYLFNDTIEGNVRLARPDASSEELALALKRGALDVLMQHRTTLVIARRLSSIRDADLILVLEDGKLVSHQGASLMQAQAQAQV